MPMLDDGVTQNMQNVMDRFDEVTKAIETERADDIYDPDMEPLDAAMASLRAALMAAMYSHDYDRNAAVR